MRIGIDTGGTFTDLVCIGAGEGRVHKLPSTPADPLQAILSGLRELRPEGLEGLEVVHGTTVGTNAFLERKGAKVALLTTRGFGWRCWPGGTCSCRVRNFLLWEDDNFGGLGPVTLKLEQKIESNLKTNNDCLDQ